MFSDLGSPPIILCLFVKVPANYLTSTPYVPNPLPGYLVSYYFKNSGSGSYPFVSANLGRILAKPFVKNVQQKRVKTDLNFSELDKRIRLKIGFFSVSDQLYFFLFQAILFFFSFAPFYFFLFHNILFFFCFKPLLFSVSDRRTQISTVDNRGDRYGPRRRSYGYRGRSYRRRSYRRRRHRAACSIFRAVAPLWRGSGRSLPSGESAQQVRYREGYRETYYRRQRSQRSHDTLHGAGQVKTRSL